MHGDTGPGGGDSPTVGIEVPDAEAWEGPYHVSKLDEAKFILNVTGANTNSAVDVNVKFTGTATSGADYVVKDSLGIMVPLMTGMDGTDDEVTTATFHVAAGAGNTWFKIYAVMDGDYDPHETVIVTILGGTHYQIGNPPKATAVIEDMTGDLDINGLNEDTEDKPGADIKFNDDDDNHNQTPDYLDASLNLQDNDLVPLVTTSHLKKPNDYAPKYVNAEGQELNTRSWFVLVFDSSRVQIYETNGGEVVSGVTHFQDADGLTRSLLLEGVGLGVGTIAFVWTAVANYPGTSTDGQEVFHETFDTVKYTVWGLDLDINSDNTGGPLQPPDRSVWEEFIESHDYALGTLMYPKEYYVAANFPVTMNRFQEVSITDSDNDRSGSEYGITFTNSYAGGASGDMQMWSVPSNWPGGLKPWSLETGGHMITSGRPYTVGELSLAVIENRATPRKIWLEGSNADASLDTYNGVNYEDRPDNAIEATLRVKQAGVWEEMGSDRVKYLIVNYNTFYPHLQWDIDPLPGVSLPAEYKPGHDRKAEVLRDSMAAGVVYGGGGRNFALAELGRDDLLRLGVSEAIVERILNSTVAGFKAAVYADLASSNGQIVLSFAGTDDAWDAIEDVAQGVGLGGQQYPEAIAIGAAIAKADGVRRLGLRITGHSLGGGLASVAYLAARAVDNDSTTGMLSYLHCDTFNAAGVHPSSLWMDVNNVWVPGVPGIVEAYDAEITEMKIDAWFLSYDILSFVQDNTVSMFPALGKRHKMAGPRISPIDADLIDDLAAHIFANFTGDSVASLLTLLHQTDAATQQNFWQVSGILLNSHKTRFYFYGLMVIPNYFDDTDNDGLWDIYGGSETIHF